MTDYPEGGEGASHKDDPHPKVRIIPASPENSDPQMPEFDPGFLSREEKGLAHFLNMSPGDPGFQKTIRDIQYEIEMEIRDDHEGNNRKLAEQAALLDAAFRFYYSGGEASKPDDQNFIIALKTQEQMLETLKNLRRMKRQVAQDYRTRELDISRAHDKFLRLRRKDDEQTNRSAQRQYDRLSE